MSVRAKQKWDIGSVFLLPLEDGDSCIGQVIGREAHVLNSAVIALFDFKGAWAHGNIPSLGLDGLFSALFVTRDLLDSGRWKVVDLRDTGGVVDAAPMRRCAGADSLAPEFEARGSWKSLQMPSTVLRLGMTGMCQTILMPFCFRRKRSPLIVLCTREGTRYR